MLGALLFRTILPGRLLLERNSIPALSMPVAFDWLSGLAFTIRLHHYALLLFVTLIDLTGRIER